MKSSGCSQVTRKYLYGALHTLLRMAFLRAPSRARHRGRLRATPCLRKQSCVRVLFFAILFFEKIPFLLCSCISSCYFIVDCHFINAIIITTIAAMNKANERTGRSAASRMVTCLEAIEQGYTFVTMCSKCDYYLQHKKLNMKAMS
jgi:hypothetical protein